MAITLIILGILSGSLLSILVGIFGAKRKIGFGWAFILSLLLTPLGGLICALISDPLPAGEKRWGCVAYLILIGGIISLIVFVLFILAMCLQ